MAAWRYGEIWGDVGRCVRYGEMWGDVNLTLTLTLTLTQTRTRTRTRTLTLTKELAAEGEICDGYGRRISGKQLNQAAWRGRDIRAKAQAASAKAPVPLRNVKAPLGDRADLPPSRTSRSTPGSRGSKEMRV